MVKILGLLAGVLIIAIILSIFFNGFGLGFGKIPANDNSKVEKSDTVTESKQVQGTSEEKIKEDQIKHVSVYVISVVKNDYIYNNISIELDEFLESIEDITENIIIEIIDDKASLKAYTNLTERLEELKIPYVEKP